MTVFTTTMVCVAIEPIDEYYYTIIFKADEERTNEEEDIIKDFEFQTDDIEEAFSYQVGEIYELELTINPIGERGVN